MAASELPRRTMVRTLLRLAGRLLLPLLARVRLDGLEHFPRTGPLILVGNHTAAMEVVLMTLYSPRVVEYLGSVDIPPEKGIALFQNLYGFIPVFRGRTSHRSMEAALEHLAGGGVLGIFPEGGIWEPAIRPAQAGVAWLSSQAGAPVLPIGFSSTTGALRKLLRFKRPELVMTVGRPLAPVTVIPGGDRRGQLQRAADEIMQRVQELLPEEERVRAQAIREESFQLELTVTDQEGRSLTPPSALLPVNGPALAKFIHRWGLIHNFQANLGIDVAPLVRLASGPDPSALRQTIARILDYLERENPFYFTYRYGRQEGTAMQAGLEELAALLDWCREANYTLRAVPVRRFTLAANGQRLTLTEPREQEKW